MRKCRVVKKLDRALCSLKTRCVGVLVQRLLRGNDRWTSTGSLDLPQIAENKHRLNILTPRAATGFFSS